MLSQDVERYIDLQRTLGYKFGDQSCSLKLFAAYAMSNGDEFVRVERVLAWAAVQTAFGASALHPGRAGSPLRARHARRKPAA